MSAGDVFKLIANDGKADRMIMATELLNQRIKDIMCMRAKQGFADPTPTLVDIERTHILFITHTSSHSPRLVTSTTKSAPTLACPNMEEPSNSLSPSSEIS